MLIFQIIWWWSNNGTTKKAIFEKNGHKIILSEGDEKKGFMHILLRHYKTNDLEAMDIINIFEIYIKGIKLAEESVSNKHLIVYMKLSNQKEFRLVLNPIIERINGSGTKTVFNHLSLRIATPLHVKRNIGLS